MSDPNFFAHLLGDSEVASLIGNRLFPVRAPQAAVRPHVVWLRSGSLRQQRYCGVDGIVRGDYQISVYANTEGAAAELADEIRHAMQDYTGLMGAVAVKHCHLESEFQVEDEDPDIYTVRQLWTIWFVET
jgi:hypothetical protein